MRHPRFAEMKQEVPAIPERTRDVLTMNERLDRRISAIEAWLRENSPEVVQEQRHLDADTLERAYWHYGYLVALRDVRKLLGKGERFN